MWASSPLRRSGCHSRVGTWRSSPCPPACTSILVTRGASADGSVMITYSCDLAGAYAIAVDDPRRGPQAGRNDRHRAARAGRQAAARQDPPGGPHLQGAGLHERAPACHQRDDLRRPRRNCTIPRADRLRDADDPGLAAGPHRAGSHRGDDPPGGRVWLRRRGRIVLHRRHPGGLDPGDGGDRPRRQGGGLGRGADSRRPGFLPCQRLADRRVPPRRPGELPLFGERGEFRPQQGLVRSEVGPAVPLLRRLLPRHAHCRGGSAIRGSGAFCGGRRRRSISRPTTIAPSRARSPIRFR